MNKKIYILVLIVVSISLMGVLYVKHNDTSLLNTVKKILPKSFKNYLKKTVFYKDELKRQLEAQQLSYQKLEKAYDNVKYNLIELQQNQNLVNSQNLPFTQLLQLDIKEIELNIKKIKTSDTQDNYRHSKKVNSFYLESDENHIYIFFKNGDIFFLNISDINKEQLEYNFKNIKNNLPDYISVKDTLLENNELYIVISDSSSNCQKMKILNANLSTEYLNFDNFFSLESTNYCEKENGKDGAKFKKGFFNGGRIEIINFENSKKMLLAAEYEDSSLLPTKDLLPKNFQENYKDATCKFLMIDFKDRSFEIFSSGHRNPQGLVVTKDNVIISTEHGSRGGDEINKIEFKKHYGWPISSYGEEYVDNFKNDENFVYLKSHLEYGFQEPIYSFVPSIGISQIIELPNSFHKRWQNNFLVSSLIDGSLYRVRFNFDYTSIITMEKIQFKKRIRDINYLKKTDSIIIAFENNQGTLGIVSAKK